MRLIIAAALIGASALAVPAVAQDKAGDKVNTVIIYGDDTCEKGSDPDVITVCAVLPERERYRIPAILRQNESPENQSWTSKVLAYQTVGRSGTMSCSPAGAGGWTGCTNQLIQQAYQEKATDPSLRFGQLIEAERAKRLATIDADAAETQKRVEELENATEARQQGDQKPATPSKP